VKIVDFLGRSPNFRVVARAAKGRPSGKKDRFFRYTLQNHTFCS